MDSILKYDWRLKSRHVTFPYLHAAQAQGDGGTQAEANGAQDAGRYPGHGPCLYSHRGRDLSIMVSGPGRMWRDITTHTGPAVGAHRGHWVPVEHGEVLTKCLGCLHVSHALVRGIGRLETSCCKQRRKFQCITSSQSLITFLGLVIWWWSSHTSLELKAYCVLMCLCLC